MLTCDLWVTHSTMSSMTVENAEELTAYQQEKNRRKAISTENLKKGRLVKAQNDLKRREQNKQKFPHLHEKIHVLQPTVSHVITSSAQPHDAQDVNPPNEQPISTPLAKIQSPPSSWSFMGVLLSLAFGVICKTIGVVINILLMSLITTIIAYLVGSKSKDNDGDSGNTYVTFEDSTEEEYDGKNVINE